MQPKNAAVANAPGTMAKRRLRPGPLRALRQINVRARRRNALGSLHGRGAASRAGAPRGHAWRLRYVPTSSAFASTWPCIARSTSAFVGRTSAGSVVSSAYSLNT